jgi:hypothetical protein
VLDNLAGYLVALDDVDGSAAAAGEAIRIQAADDSDHGMLGIPVEHLALVRALRGDLARAAKQEGYSRAAFQRHGFEREFTETMTYNRLMALLRERLVPDELERLLAEGAALKPEEAIALALEE